MKIVYDEKTDTLSLILKAGVPVAESDEDKPGVILDYDEDGDLIFLEILVASRRVTDARTVEFETEPAGVRISPETQCQSATRASAGPVTARGRGA